jgi:hypothetical protein
VVAAARHEERGRGAAREDGRHDGHIGEVGAPGEGVVGHHHVAQCEIREARAHHLDGLGHRAQVHGNVRRVRHQSARRIEDGARVVEALLDVGRDRGIAEHRAHLLGDRHEAIAKDLEPDRIGALEVDLHGARRPGLVAEQQLPLRSDAQREARVEHDRAGVLEDERRTRQRRARHEIFAGVDGRRDAPRVGKPHALVAQGQRSADAVGGWRGPGSRGMRARGEDAHARRDDLDGAAGARVAEARLVLARECGRPVRVAGLAHRERRVGADVAQIESALDAQRAPRDALALERVAPGLLQLREDLAHRSRRQRGAGGRG